MNMINRKVETSLREAGAGETFSPQRASKLRALHALGGAFDPRTSRQSRLAGECAQLAAALETRVHTEPLDGPVSVRDPEC